MKSIKLQHPKTDDNKYSRGMVTVIGGSASFPGAAMLAAGAAYAASRSGSGYVTVFTSPKNVSLIQEYKPSLVVRSWKNKKKLMSGLIASSNQRPRSYVVGPGFDSKTKKVKKILSQALTVNAPLVIDGGALGSLKDPYLRHKLSCRSAKGLVTVLTPHMGEARRLAKCFSLCIEDPEALCIAIALATGSICVLKGPVTFVSDGKQVGSMDKGPAALAKAGTGDVLAGIVGALLLRCNHPFEAALNAVELHAFTACQCISQTGDIALTPEDIIEGLKTSVKDFEEGR